MSKEKTIVFKKMIPIEIKEEFEKMWLDIRRNENSIGYNGLRLCAGGASRH